MRILVINPNTRSVASKEIPTLDDLDRFFLNGPVECCTLPTGDVVFIDDEALLHARKDIWGKAVSYVVPFAPQPLTGFAIITGPDGTDARMSEQALSRCVQWCGEPSIRH